MNTTDFTQLGGFPLDQKVLKFNQDALIQHLGAYYAGGGTTPLIISGMKPVALGGPFGLMGIDNGFCVIAGELLEFRAAALPPLGGGTVAYVKIFETKQPALFNDSTTKLVWDITRYATISTTDGEPLSNFKLWHEVVLGPRSKTPWALYWEDTASATLKGSISYRKDQMANTLHIRGYIQAFSGLFGSGEDTVPISRTIGPGFPDGYRPATAVPFAMYRRYYGANFMKDINSVQYLHSVNAELVEGGALLVSLIRPEAGVTDYTVRFNQIIPLG